MNTNVKYQLEAGLGVSKVCTSLKLAITETVRQEINNTLVRKQHWMSGNTLQVLEKKMSRTEAIKKEQ